MTIMHICPHCHTPGISFTRRMHLGPALAATCQACGRKVGVPYSSLWTLLPFLVAIILASLVDSFAVQTALWAGGFVLMSVCHLKFVPLIKR